MLYSTFQAPLLLVGTTTHSAMYFTLFPSVTFRSFRETCSSNSHSSLCSVASVIVSPFFEILHIVPLKWTSRPFSANFFTKIRFPHTLGSLHRAHHITWLCDYSRECAENKLSATQLRQSKIGGGA